MYCVSLSCFAPQTVHAGRKDRLVIKDIITLTETLYTLVVTLRAVCFSITTVLLCPHSMFFCCMRSSKSIPVTTLSSISRVVFLLDACRDCSVAIVTRLRTEQLRNHSSIPGRGKIFLSSSATGQDLTVLWVPSAFYFGVKRPEHESDKILLFFGCLGLFILG